MRIKFIFIILFPIIFLSCNQKVNYSKIFELAQTERAKGDFMNCIMNLSEIIKNSTDINLKQKAQFNIADIYMNDIKNYSFALDEFNNVLKYDINNNIHKKSLFMYSYICSNYLDMYTNAYNSYNLFLDKYPDDELVPSVLYEIEQLQPMIDVSKKLING